MTTLFEVLRQQSLDDSNNHDSSQYKFKSKEERACIPTIQERITRPLAGSSSKHGIYDTAASNKTNVRGRRGAITSCTTATEPATKKPKQQQRIGRSERLRRKQEQAQQEANPQEQPVPILTEDHAESANNTKINSASVSTTGPSITRTFSSNVEFLQELAKEAAPPVRRTFSDNVLFLQELAKEVAADAPPVRRTFSNNIEFLQDLAKEVAEVAAKEVAADAPPVRRTFSNNIEFLQDLAKEVAEVAADHMESSSSSNEMTRRFSNSMGYLQGLAREASDNMLETVSHLREEGGIGKPDVLRSVLQEKMTCLGKNVGTLTKSAFGGGGGSSSSPNNLVVDTEMTMASSSSLSPPPCGDCRRASRRQSKRSSLGSIDMSKLMETTPLKTAEGVGDSSCAGLHYYEVAVRASMSITSKGEFDAAQIGLTL